MTIEEIRALAPDVSDEALTEFSPQMLAGLAAGVDECEQEDETHCKWCGVTISGEYDDNGDYCSPNCRDIDRADNDR